MSSLIDEPNGWDRSIINLTDPSFLGAAPIGEQWVFWKGGVGKWWGNVKTIAKAINNICDKEWVRVILK